MAMAACVCRQLQTAAIARSTTRSGFNWSARAASRLIRNPNLCSSPDVGLHPLDFRPGPLEKAKPMPDSNQIRYGLIGCGMMGQEHLRNIALLSGVEVAAIFEPDAQMRKASQQLAPQARMVTRIEDVFEASGLDALVITSPNYCHAALLEMIFAQRPLPFLVEKPACISIAEARALESL